MEIVKDNQTYGQVSEPALEPVLVAIRRLEEVIEYETHLLLGGQTVDLSDINANKSRGLRDFNKAMGKAANSVDKLTLKSLQPFLDNLRKKVDRNCDALKLHLRAVTELTTIIRDALETQDADGTYTARQLRDGQGA